MATRTQKKSTSGAVNVTEVRLGSPNRKQRRFLKSRKRHVAFGGARGGGKSWAVRFKGVLLAQKFPGIKILIIRRTYQELLNNHIEPLRKMLPVELARYNKTEKIFRFENGSTIKFGYCKNDADLDQYQGAEYDVIFFDEAGQLQKPWLDVINKAVRGVNDFPKRSYYTLNPGGPSHAYFKRVFVDQKYEGAENPNDYEFIQSLVTDNVALMKAQPDYVAELENLPPKLRAAWRYGRWDVFEGQFFEDFRAEPDTEACIREGKTPEQLIQERRWTHVIEPFPPTHMRIYRSYDFGYSKPFSCAWWGVDKDGVIYRLLELYGCTAQPNEGVKWTVDKQFAEISRIEREHPWLANNDIYGVADPAIWDASRGESIAETALRYGVSFEPGDHKRIPGWMQCHYRLQFDENGYPRMYVFKNCKAFIRTIPQLMYSETQPEDLDTSLEDHVADEWRYFCMMRPVKPIITQEKRVVQDDPLDLLKDERFRRR